LRVKYSCHYTVGTGSEPIPGYTRRKQGRCPRVLTGFWTTEWLKNLEKFDKSRASSVEIENRKKSYIHCMLEIEKEIPYCNGECKF
jgi:hypothetical protein